MPDFAGRSVDPASVKMMEKAEVVFYPQQMHPIFIELNRICL